MYCYRALNKCCSNHRVGVRCLFRTCKLAFRAASSAWLALQADVAKSSPCPRVLRASLSRRLRRGAKPWRRLPHDDAPRVLRPRPVRPHYSGALRLLPVRPRLLGQRVRSARLPLCLPLQLLLPTGRLLRCVPRHQCTEIAPCSIHQCTTAPMHQCTIAPMHPVPNGTAFGCNHMCQILPLYAFRWRVPLQRRAQRR